MKGQKFFAVYGNPLDFSTEMYPLRVWQYTLRNHLGGYFKFNYLNGKGVCSKKGKKFNLIKIEHKIHIFFIN